MITFVYTGTCSAQSLLWTCPASSDNEVVYFPNITIDQDSLANSVQDSPYLSEIGLYVYRFQPMITDVCNDGEISVQFCFVNAENSTNIDMLIVLGTVLFIEPDGASLTGILLDQISISTTVKCDPELSNNTVCCQSESIDVTLTNETNAFAVQFPNQTLLEYNGSQSQVETFVATQTQFIGIGSNGLSIFQANGRFMDLNLRFLQFTINPQNVTTTDLPTSIIIIGTMVSVGILISILVTIAVVIAGIQWQKRKKIMHMNQLLGSNNTGNSNHIN